MASVHKTIMIFLNCIEIYVAYKAFFIIFILPATVIEQNFFPTKIQNSFSSEDKEMQKLRIWCWQDENYNTGGRDRSRKHRGRLSRETRLIETT